MPSTHLTAPERETVITLDDASDVASVWTYQRRVITRLERNPLARRIETLDYGSTVGARFELPAWAITFRSKRRTGGTGNPEALARARQHANKATGSSPSAATGEGVSVGSRGQDGTRAGSQPASA